MYPNPKPTFFNRSQIWTLKKLYAGAGARAQLNLLARTEARVFKKLVAEGRQISEFYYDSSSFLIPASTSASAFQFSPFLSQLVSEQQPHFR